jgi:hypothetical protein
MEGQIPRVWDSSGLESLTTSAKPQLNLASKKGKEKYANRPGKIGSNWQSCHRSCYEANYLWMEWPKPGRSDQPSKLE